MTKPHTATGQRIVGSRNSSFEIVLLLSSFGGEFVIFAATYSPVQGECESDGVSPPGELIQTDAGARAADLQLR